MEDVEAIVAKLTKAQRETLLDNRRCVASYKPAQKLIDLGLWSGDRDEYTIYPSRTELGQSVRTYLLSQTKE